MARKHLATYPNLKAILFDLDDTLLINPMSKFIPVYFELICGFVADLVPAEQLIPALLQGTRAMEKNIDPSLANNEVFFKEFFSCITAEESLLRPRLEQFYIQEYPKLAILTKPAPGSLRIVELAFQTGLDVVIATNPLFPRNALEQRIEWAGVPVTEFNYSLVTTFEIMHAAKPNPDYYYEILDYLSRKPGESLMVGDDWERDIIPAASIGIHVFWINDTNTVRPKHQIPPELWLGQGSLTYLEEILSGSNPTLS